MNALEFGHPEALWLLLLLLPAGLILALAAGHKQRLLSRLVDPASLPRLAPARRPGGARTRLLLWLLALGLGLFALARPQWGHNWEEVKRRGLDVVVVLDTSKSMLANDIKPTRLQRAKWGIADLVKKLKGDRIGLVAFAGSNFLQCPLTIDYAAFMMHLDDVYAGIIPKGGTAIGPALQTTIKSFEKATGADRVVILISDGEDHEEGLDEVIAACKKEGIKIYVVGVGSREGGLIPITDEQGNTQYLKDPDDLVIKTSLNEPLLEKIALGTGGVYVRSTGAEFGLERIYTEGIAELKRAEQESRLMRRSEERYVWFLGASLLVFGLESLMSGVRRPRAKKGEVSS